MKLSLPTFILAAATLQAESSNARLYASSTNDGHTLTSPRGDIGSTSMPVNTRAMKSSKTDKSRGKIDVPASPPLLGVSNSGSKPKVILAQDTNYPPFTGIGTDLRLTGFGPDFAMGIEEVCNIDITLVQTSWSECWGDNVIGNGLLSGYYHGCTTYTGTKGVRQRYLEFSAPILPMNKAAGILTRLVKGEPVVDGSNSLDGVNVGDVVGWAPTADVLAISKNLCTGDFYSGYTLIPNTPESDENENDVALSQLLDETVDALWIYADQAASYKAACDIDNVQEWDCDLWSKFGTDFAYVQTGFYDYMESGTTLAISKKGSGLADTLNPCIEAFIKTKSYKDLCTKYDMEGACFQNEFFDKSDKEVMPYSLPTNELTTSCSDGYCPCPP